MPVSSFEGCRGMAAPSQDLQISPSGVGGVGWGGVEGPLPPLLPHPFALQSLPSRYGTKRARSSCTAVWAAATQSCPGTKMAMKSLVKLEPNCWWAWPPRTPEASTAATPPGDRPLCSCTSEVSEPLSLPAKEGWPRQPVSAVVARGKSHAKPCWG